MVLSACTSASVKTAELVIQLTVDVLALQAGQDVFVNNVTTLSLYLLLNASHSRADYFTDWRGCNCNHKLETYRNRDAY